MRLLIMVSLFLCLGSFPALGQDSVAVEGGFMAMLSDTAPAWVVVGLIILRQIAEVIAKTIPDNADGMIGMVRKVFKLIALYVPNQK